MSELTDVPHGTLRTWERRLLSVPELRWTEGGGKRQGHRRYTAADIEIVRQIAYWVRERGMTFVCAAHRIAEGRGREADESGRLTEKALGDHRLRRAIDELADVIRARIFEGFSGSE